MQPLNWFNYLVNLIVECNTQFRSMFIFGFPGQLRGHIVKRFERSNGLDIALHKNIPLPFKTIKTPMPT